MTLNTVYTYDTASRIASIAYPSGLAVAYARDAAGRITDVDAFMQAWKSAGFTPTDCKYCPAGLSGGISPPGDIWSVFRLSP